MKALVYKKYGQPEVLQIEQVQKPVPKDDEILVKVHAVSLNSSDYEMLTAKPAYIRMWGLFKPNFNVLGSDIAGIVEAIGKDVTEFKPGDKVFGDVFERWGGLAEYACAKEKDLLHKPRGMSFEQVAALPQAGVVALQGLRYNGGIKSGQKVLINGAGGGAGTFAIQIAKSLGAEVTGVDNGLKQEMMKSLGADYVIDYTKEDFRKNGKEYDFILDMVAHRSVFANKRALAKDGTYALVGGSIPNMLQVLFFGSLISLFSKKKMGILVHDQNKEDLTEMLLYHNSGRAIGVIAKKFDLEKAAEAFEYLGKGKALGKVVVCV